jgi:hypothetical protein
VLKRGRRVPGEGSPASAQQRHAQLPESLVRISGYLDDARCVEDKARQEMLEEAAITGDRILNTRRGTVLLQEAPEYGKSWLVVPVLVHVRGSRYQLECAVS